MISDTFDLFRILIEILKLRNSRFCSCTLFYDSLLEIQFDESFKFYLIFQPIKKLLCNVKWEAFFYLIYITMQNNVSYKCKFIRELSHTKIILKGGQENVTNIDIQNVEQCWQVGIFTAKCHCRHVLFNASSCLHFQLTDKLLYTRNSWLEFTTNSIHILYTKMHASSNTIHYILNSGTVCSVPEHMTTMKFCGENSALSALFNIL